MDTRAVYAMDLRVGDYVDMEPFLEDVDSVGAEFEYAEIIEIETNPDYETVTIFTDQGGVELEFAEKVTRLSI